MFPNMYGVSDFKKNISYKLSNTKLFVMFHKSVAMPTPTRNCGQFSYKHGSQTR